MIKMRDLLNEYNADIEYKIGNDQVQRDHFHQIYNEDGWDLSFAVSSGVDFIYAILENKIIGYLKYYVEDETLNLCEIDINKKFRNDRNILINLSKLFIKSLTDQTFTQIKSDTQSNKEKKAVMIIKKMFNLQ